MILSAVLIARSLSKLGLLAVVLVLLLETPASASTDSVLVSLFQAEKKIDRIIFREPVASSSVSDSRRIYGNIKELRARAGRLILLSQPQLSQSQPSHLQLSHFQLSQPEAAPLQPLPVSPLRLQILANNGGKVTLKLPEGSWRSYRGTLYLSLDRQGNIVVSNRITLKQYVASVVGSETDPAFPLEALKAQSVLVQTSMRRYRSGDLLPDTTEKQAYLGAEYERSLVRKAVEATWGQALCYHGRPIKVFFHSTCAGATSRPEVFGGDTSGLAYYRGVRCSYCQRSPFWKETKIMLSERVYLKKLPEGVPQIRRCDQAGRPLQIEFPEGQRRTGYAFWLAVGQNFGWDKLPGMRYQISRDARGGVILRSTGAGHGVGLCQWGACGLAVQGKNFKQILHHYFPCCDQII